MNQRGLPRTGGPEDGQGLTLGDVQVDVAEYVLGLALVILALGSAGSIGLAGGGGSRGR